ncbi:hypothetical protein [Bartonella quintana]|uniref:hypothetical protein n=1 Tax=Bartonella quintana TaxID=803 RepID=UPI0035E3D79B
MHLERQWVQPSECTRACWSRVDIIDTGGIIVHRFYPEIGLFYNLEKMWLAPDLNNTKLVFFRDH